MKSIMQLLREYFLAIVVLVCGLEFCTRVASSEASNSCTYYFIRQPRTDMSCNPWPLITNSQLTIDLLCHIRGPQSNDLPNAIWYRTREGGAIERIEVDNLKYTNPTSSVDLGNGFRRVNFTLLVNSVSEVDDLGCYWCQVDVSADNCSFTLINSTRFCLYPEATYPHFPSCISLPSNDTTVCASNRVCDNAPFNTPSPPLVESTTSILLPTTTALASTIHVIYSARTEQFSGTPMPTLVLPTASVPRKMDTLSNNPTMISSTSREIPPQSLQALVPSSSHPRATPTVPVAALVTESASQSNRNAAGLSALQIGFYIGLSVCIVLLVIILALISVVVLLCQKKPSKTPSNTGIVSEFSTNDQDMIWRRESGNILPTSIVNSSSSFALLSPRSRSSEHSHNEEEDPLYSSVDDIPREQTRLASRGNPHYEDTRSHFGTMQGRNSTNGSIPRIPLKHASKEVQGSGAKTSSKVITMERASSPETHYYHVLEQPQYYNYDWLTSDSNGRELLLQSWRERPVNDKDRWQSVGVAVEDETGEEQYHWNVVPTAREHLPARERLGSKSSLSRGSQRRHPYQRLDQSTLETAREYAKVSITESVDASDNDEHS